MLNGFMIQLINTVKPKPFQSLATCFIEEKSICTIIGNIMAQTKMATGILTVEILISLSVLMESPPMIPTAIPTPMHKSTQRVRYFSKNPIDFFASRSSY